MMSMKIENRSLANLLFGLVEGNCDFMIISIVKEEISSIDNFFMKVQDRRTKIIRVVSLSMRSCEVRLYFFIHAQLKINLFMI